MPRCSVEINAIRLPPANGDGIMVMPRLVASVRCSSVFPVHVVTFESFHREISFLVYAGTTLIYVGQDRIIRDR